MSPFRTEMGSAVVREQRFGRVVWLGRRRYEPIHELQAVIQTARRHGELGDIILLVEHEPVVSMGRNAASSHLLLGPEELQRRGVDFAKTGRGGDVTYHGPGQLVGYPILDLKPDRCDVRRYVRALAEVMVLLARELGVEAGVVDGMIGVWADAAAPTVWAGQAWSQSPVKIGAIGVRLSRWITMHGFALNLQTDLNAFRMIVPCGIAEFEVASVASLLGDAPPVAELAMNCAPFLSRALEMQLSEPDNFSSVPTEDLAAALMSP